MSFDPKKYLEKFGWQGSGLGKNEDGIKTYIKVAKREKEDSRGVGMRDDFSKSWEKMFDAAAKKIQVDSLETEISITRTVDEADEVKPLTYGRFVQAPSLIPQSDDSSEGSNTDSASSMEVKKKKKKDKNKSVNNVAPTVADSASPSSVEEQPKPKKRKQKDAEHVAAPPPRVDIDSDDDGPTQMVGLGSGTHSSSHMKGKMARLLRAEKEGWSATPMMPSSQVAVKASSAVTVESKEERRTRKREQKRKAAKAAAAAAVSAPAE